MRPSLSTISESSSYLRIKNLFLTNDWFASNYSGGGYGGYGGYGGCGNAQTVTATSTVTMQETSTVTQTMTEVRSSRIRAFSNLITHFSDHDCPDNSHHDRDHD